MSDLRKQKSQGIWRKHDFSDLRYSIAFERDGHVAEAGRNWLENRLYISEFSRRGFLTRVSNASPFRNGEPVVLHATLDLVTPDDDPIHRIFFLRGRVLRAEALSPTETLYEIEIDRDSSTQWRRFRALFRLRQMRINQIFKKTRA